MAKIKINDTDYYTDDFNEDQMKMYNEIQIASSEMERISYTHQVLAARRESLAGMIVQAAEEPKVDDASDEPEA
jgi:hypothetical protein